MSSIHLSLLLKEGGFYCPRIQNQTWQEGLHWNTSWRTQTADRYLWVNRAPRARQLIHSQMLLKSCFITTLIQGARSLIFAIPLYGIFVLFKRGVPGARALWQAPSLGSSRVMLGTELPSEHGVSKKRNKIIARVSGSVTHTETGSQRQGGCFVPLKVSTLLNRQQGRKKRPLFGVLRTTLKRWFLGHPTSACFSVGRLYLSRMLCISMQWWWVIRSQERYQRPSCLHVRELKDGSSWKTH